ncbi:hypothetical protein J4E91_006464 [Alternaria rosae]|nr:hypothetical protein J4E91_006464 [Alternaria rosae]
MCEPNFTGLPVELKVLVFTGGCLEYDDLFQSSLANKEWHEIICRTNDIRQSMFLPRLLNTGVPKILSSTRGPVAGLSIFQGLPDATNKEKASLHGTAWTGLKLHPLLSKFRAPKRQPSLLTKEGTYRSQRLGLQRPGHLEISYQLLKHCNKPHLKEDGADWRDVPITYPPIRRLLLRVEYYDCLAPLGVIQSSYFCVTLENPTGVTMGDVVDRACQGRVPYNIGLIPNDGSCAGWHCSRGPPDKCRIYNYTYTFVKNVWREPYKSRHLKKKEYDWTDHLDEFDTEDTIQNSEEQKEQERRGYYGAYNE